MNIERVEFRFRKQADRKILELVLVEALHVVFILRQRRINVESEKLLQSAICVIFEEKIFSQSLTIIIPRDHMVATSWSITYSEC